MERTENTFEGWALLELMGHRRLAGKITAATMAGVPMLRIDVYDGDDEAPCATQFYSGSAVYAVSPMTEDLCRSFATLNRPQPVCLYDFPLLPQGHDPADDNDDGPFVADEEDED